jgi:glutamate-1-semialdehyde 2,1-aminomutase
VQDPSFNPLSSVAGCFAIEDIERTNTAMIVVGQATKGLSAKIDLLGLPFVVYNQGSIVYLEISTLLCMVYPR